MANLESSQSPLFLAPLTIHRMLTRLAAHWLGAAFHLMTVVPLLPSFGSTLVGVEAKQSMLLCLFS